MIPISRALIFSLVVGFISTATICVAAQVAAKPNDRPFPTVVMNWPLPVDKQSNITLSEKRGKVILVYLWANWCGPCRNQFPEITALQDKYKDRDFEVIGLNVGDEDAKYETFSKIKNFAAKQKLGFSVVRSPRAVSMEIYKFANFDAIPLAVLLDRQGRAVDIFRGAGPGMAKRMQNAIENVIQNSSGI